MTNLCYEQDFQLQPTYSTNSSLIFLTKHKSRLHGMCYVCVLLSFFTRTKATPIAHPPTQAQHIIASRTHRRTHTTHEHKLPRRLQRQYAPHTYISGITSPLTPSAPKPHKHIHLVTVTFAQLPLLKRHRHTLDITSVSS